MDVLELTIRQLDRELASGRLSKYDILKAASEHGAHDTLLAWLSARIV